MKFWRERHWCGGSGLGFHNAATVHWINKQVKKNVLLNVAIRQGASFRPEDQESHGIKVLSPSVSSDDRATF
jgi:hypothetical protein